MDDESYSTRSLSEGAYLYLNGMQLLSAVDRKGNECFVFADKDGCARNLAAEFFEDGSVPARTYGIALNQLRRESSDARKARQ